MDRRGWQSRRGGAKSNEISFQGRSVEGEGDKMIWKWPREARHIPIPSPGCVAWAGYERKKKANYFQVAAMEAMFSGKFRH